MKRSLLSICLALAAGCVAELEQPPVVESDMDGGKIIQPPNGGPDAGTPTGETPVRLAPLDQNTYWNTVPIAGSGPKGGHIYIVADNGNTEDAPISQSGDFCVDMPLESNSTNSFEIWATSATGVKGASVTADINQSGSPPPPPTAPPAENKMLGTAREGNPYFSGDVTGGSLEHLVDGRDDTHAFLLNAWWDADYVWLKMGERNYIKELTVWGSEDCRLEHYQIWTSNRDAPGTPTAENNNWDLACDVADLVSASCTYEQPAEMKHVVIWFVTDDCERWDGTGQHKIVEVEAWTQEGHAPPAQAAPSCGGGN